MNPSTRNTGVEPLTLPAPTKLQAVGITTTSAILNWMYTGDNEQGFDIEVSLDGTNFSRHTRSGEGSWYNLVVGLTPATTYWFRVIAMNTFGPSAPSNVLLVRTSWLCELRKDVRR